MIYQQEIREINDFYDRYKDRKIVYSKEVSQGIGLVQRDTAIKLGTLVIKGVLISSTMESFVFMARLNDSLKQSFYDQNKPGALKVQLKFISRESGKTELFSIDTKFLNFNSQGLDQPGLHFVAMQIRRKIPNDLIRIFGLYHKEVDNRLKEKKKKVECFILANEMKIDCLTESISKGVLALSLDEKGLLNMNQKAIAILRIVKTGEVMEIIGTVSRISDGSDGTCKVNLQFNMEDQSPRFGYSIHVLSNIINS